MIAPLALVAVAGILSTASVIPNSVPRTAPSEHVNAAQAAARSENTTRQVSRSEERTSLLPIGSTPSPTEAVDSALDAAPSALPSATALLPAALAGAAPVNTAPANTAPTGTTSAGTTPTPSPEAAPSASATPAPQASATPSASAAPKETAPAASPSPTPTPTPTAAPTPTPAPTIPALGADAGTLYVKSSVNVRSGPGKGYDSLTVLAPGATVTATDVVADGWQQINRKGKAGWIRESFLSTDKPVVDAAPKKSAATSSAKSDAQCSKAGDLESKLTQRTVAVLRAVCANFPEVTSYGGYRAGDSGYHGSGQAIDVMISGEAGWDIAKWARSNASDLGVIEVIYEQKIWTTQRSGDGWRSMSDRGSVSANHYDHVHLSVR
ncbi:MAG TPA: SH3 domain-containing protein [Arachnia sp.]|nr:SH3 domain-containing protein [Arachnia sp.]HMT87611.1 SH3 domain-containing protein [Arachnia sp.]